MLQLGDLEYLSYRTGLTEQKILLLAESEKDLDLIINEIAKEEIENGLLHISFNLFTKLYVFRISRELDYNLKEKSYVSETISSIYPKLEKHKIENHTIQEDWETLWEPDEQMARYYFTLLSMFKDSLDRKRRSYPNPNIFYAKAVEGFENANKKELATHLKTWILLMRRMKEEYWN
jgi:hypothetical protein